MRKPPRRKYLQIESCISWCNASISWSFIYFLIIYICVYGCIYLCVCVYVCVPVYCIDHKRSHRTHWVLLQKQYEPRIYEIIKLRLSLCCEHAGFVEILALGVSCVQRAWMITVKEHCCHNFVILHTGAHTYIHQYTHIRKPHRFIYIKLIYHVKNVRIFLLKNKTLSFPLTLLKYWKM